eukprot:SAG31_NODE_2315_length_5951_cov_9.080472_4_plen_179_part_00
MTAGRCFQKKVEKQKKKFEAKYKNAVGGNVKNDKSLSKKNRKKKRAEDLEARDEKIDARIDAKDDAIDAVDGATSDACDKCKAGCAEAVKSALPDYTEDQQKDCQLTPDGGGGTWGSCAERACGLCPDAKAKCLASATSENPLGSKPTVTICKDVSEKKSTLFCVPPQQRTFVIVSLL